MAETDDITGQVYDAATRFRSARLGNGLNEGGGDGTSPPMVENGLKSRVDWLYTLIPWLIGLLVTVFLAVLVTASTTNSRIDKLSETTSALNREVGTLHEQANDTNRRLDRIELKLDKIDAKLK